MACIPAPPESHNYRSSNDALSSVREFAKAHGFAVVKQRTSRDRKGELKQIYLRCDRGGTYRASSPKQSARKTQSRLSNCPFSAVIDKNKLYGSWGLRIRNWEHNHPPSSSPKSHVQYGQEDKAKYRSFILKLLANHIDPKQILAAVNRRDPNAAIQIRDIYNLRKKLPKVVGKSGKSLDCEKQARCSDLPSTQIAVDHTLGSFTGTNAIETDGENSSYAIVGVCTPPSNPHLASGEFLKHQSDIEANFMRDFSCCGMTLPAFHDLVRHKEEAHTITKR